MVAAAAVLLLDHAIKSGGLFALLYDLLERAHVSILGAVWLIFPRPRRTTNSA